MSAVVDFEISDLKSRTVPAGYKQTEVGVIPEDWELVPLFDVLSKGRLGGNYPNQLRESACPLMKMGNIARAYIDTSKVEYITPGVVPEEQHKLRNGDVLFNTRNTLDLVGKVAIWRNELPLSFYNSNLMRLEFDQNKICSNEYANAALNSHGAITILRGLATGTTSVAAIYTRDLMGMPFLTPPLPEQRAIAKALSDVDALLGALDRLIAKKRDLKQAAMQQLLTGQTRLPGFHGEWEVKRLGELANIRMCKRIFAEQTYTSGDIPFFKIGTFGKEPDAFITESLYEEYRNKYSFPAKGDILLSAAGTLGRTVIYDGQPAYFQDSNIVWLELDKTLLCNEYLNYCYQVIAWASPEGSTIPRLYNAIIRDSAISLPPLPEQTAIAEVLSDMDAEIVALERRREKTRALKRGMMQELLTGKTRLL